jgi:gas vesicle protein GvpL/GvpF
VSERGCWVYGITDRDPGQDLTWPPGVAGCAVRTVPADGLTALVSDVDLAEFGEEALARNLEDLGWLEQVARAHHHVIESASQLLPLLPVSLATVYASEPSMTAAFAARRQDFTEALAMVRDRVEWGVKVYAQPKRTESDQTEPRQGDEAGTDTGPGSGLAYLKRRREQLNASQDSRRDTAAAAHAVHSALAGQAIQARLHPPQSPRLSGADIPMLLNAAYLLGRAEDTVFQNAVAAVADAHPELRVELTGPWPPYSFAGNARRDAP